MRIRFASANHANNSQYLQARRAFALFVISQEDVQHIAHLARIGITEEEVKKFQKDLEAILNYIKELEEVDTANVEPTSHVTGAENVMREDNINEKGKESASQRLVRLRRKKLIGMAPETRDGYVKTKAIL